MTSGTVFDKTRTPLTTWFATAWYMTNKKTAAVSTKGLQRVLELGSYQTAWTMLHKYRSAMVCPGRELLSGDVEVDETLVVVAVEVFSPKGFGRARLQPVPYASKKTLTKFVTDTIEPGSVVLTDGWGGYNLNWLTSGS